MSNIYEIRHHIAAVEQTRKITGAMEIVSSTRMKRVMQHIEYNHRYFDRVSETMKQILLSSQDISHRYLDHHRGRRRAFIVIAGDKGMAGDYNDNVLEFATEKIEEHSKKENAEEFIITIGNIASEYFKAKGEMPDIELLGNEQDPSLERARRLMSDMFDLYDRNLVDEVFVVYTSFYGETKNKPILRRLLPIRLVDLTEFETEQPLVDAIYVPDTQTVFDMLVPQYVLGIIFGVMVQAFASEHFARMNAMHSATDNADEMLKRLTTQYNMARQTAITQEIAEITGASEILSKGV